MLGLLLSHSAKKQQASKFLFCCVVRYDRKVAFALRPSTARYSRNASQTVRYGRRRPQRAIDGGRLRSNVGDGLKNLALKACCGRRRRAQCYIFETVLRVRTRSVALERRRRLTSAVTRRRRPQ